ncbi:Cellulose synthase [Parasponia andersonii]|uniref:Cellulose synthase n=2 Tax=Parasponia andersonii TaxID=3476 RepID=A0A2P5B3P8_PARAD|nr:Cellulose synthase [Parasponia andersonii]
MGREGHHVNPKLFETKKAKGRIIYRLFASSIFIGICLIWFYRLSHIPKQGQDGRWAWIGLLGAELWFGFYWILTQAHRWNLVYRHTFKDRLSQRYGELPGVDVFVCTADPIIEPPLMMINTVLSAMAYDYPPEKLSVYLSDDGGSDLTFYALLEASKFAKHWIQYCKKFEIEPRSPAAYFRSMSLPAVRDSDQASNFVTIKKLYKEMENRIEKVTKLEHISEDDRSRHKGFSEWDSYWSRRDHHTILQILVDGPDPNVKDVAGCTLPTLVYLAREKRPQYHHNFKAGAINALIRVSSKISNGEVILNVDCDMYSNNSQSMKDALCFLLDEEQGHEIAYVQFPQAFENVTKNDLYGSDLRTVTEVEFHGVDGYGGPLYIGSGCFHRRDILCGRKFGVEYKKEEKKERRKRESVHELEEKSKDLASCAYENNTQWGKEMGLKYGCSVEDVITGLSIQSQGWKSVYFNPSRPAFLGVAPTTLAQTLVQHKRWSEGHFQIFLSKYSTAWYAYKKISLGLQLGYCCYSLWAPNCLATLYYSFVPSLYLLSGIPLFPRVTSPWVIPFVYVVTAKYTYSLAEFRWSGGTLLGWWNEQRMWFYKRATSYLFAFIDTILNSLGFTKSAFVITAKVADEDVSERFEKEIMEFGTSSPMFTILSVLAILNLYCFIGVVKEAIMGKGIVKVFETMSMQILLCGLLTLINLPLYQGLFLRKDKGKMPSSLTVKSVAFALFACTSFTFMY